MGVKSVRECPLYIAVNSWSSGADCGGYRELSGLVTMESCRLRCRLSWKTFITQTKVIVSELENTHIKSPAPKIKIDLVLDWMKWPPMPFSSYVFNSYIYASVASESYSGSVHPKTVPHDRMVCLEVLNTSLPWSDNVWYLLLPSSWAGSSLSVSVCASSMGSSLGSSLNVVVSVWWIEYTNIID